MTGGFATAMARLDHYFTPFQTFVIGEAETEDGRFDFRIALEILEREAEYRAEGASLQGIFLYQFETLCRNRLGYDQGLEAMAGDPDLRRRLAGVDPHGPPPGGDHRLRRHDLRPQPALSRKRRATRDKPVLFGEKEGKIALANRRKDPLFLFSALARHLGYPSVPRPKLMESPEQTLLLVDPPLRTAGNPNQAAGRRAPRRDQHRPVLRPEGQEKRAVVSVATASRPSRRGA